MDPHPGHPARAARPARRRRRHRRDPLRRRPRPPGPTLRRPLRKPRRRRTPERPGCVHPRRHHPRRARAAAGPDTTLLVASPDLLTTPQQRGLHEAIRDSGGRTLLVAPGTPSLDTLAPGVRADAAPSFDSTLAPDCTLPAARRAGPADTGGLRYTTDDTRADLCYPSDGLATLVVLPAREDDTGTTRPGDTVLLGAPDILYNDRLDDEGNASLALQLLGSRPHLVWYLPSLSDDSATDAGDRSFFDLIPRGWLWATLQLLLAAALAALWRARRFGPLVPEKLPVAIRASETTEGRARLYRRTDARDRAAAALRSTTRTRLAPSSASPRPGHTRPRS